MVDLHVNSNMESYGVEREDNGSKCDKSSAKVPSHKFGWFQGVFVRILSIRPVFEVPSW